MKLFRGIYTDDEHARIIRDNGIQSKWYVSINKYMTNRCNIEAIINKGYLKLGDICSRNQKEKAIYAVATLRDACFYALREAEGVTYHQNLEIKQGEKYTGSFNPYIIEFDVPVECIYLDPQDFFFPFLTNSEYDEGIRYDLICQVLGKKIVDKYLSLFAKKEYNKYELVYLLCMEMEAVKSVYNNNILLCGKYDINVFSSFVVRECSVDSKKIINVKKMILEECKELVREEKNTNKLFFR